MRDWAITPRPAASVPVGGSRKRGGERAMEEGGPEQRQRGGEQGPARAAANGDCSRPLSLSGQSYWLDVWLFILFDLALLVFVYLLP